MRLTREKERFNKECRNRGKRLTRHKMDTFCNNLPNKCSTKKAKQLEMFKLDREKQRYTRSKTTYLIMFYQESRNRGKSLNTGKQR